MENPTIRETPLEARSESPELCQVIRLCCAVLLFPMAVIPAISRAQTQQQSRPAGSDPIPEPPVPAVLAAFDRYEVVGMPEAHGMKDVDDLIFLGIPLTHGAGFRADDAVIYEKDYPSLTFVISELGNFDTDSPALSRSPFATWPVPSLARTKGTWLGALDLGHFFPTPFTLDKDCSCRVVCQFPAVGESAR